MTDDIATFIRARLVDDEATAQRTYTLRVALDTRHQAPWSEQPDENNALLLLGQYARRHALAVEAKRRILREHQDDGDRDGPVGEHCLTCVVNVTGVLDRCSEMAPYPCLTIRALASEWSAHDDYRQEWTS